MSEAQTNGTSARVCPIKMLKNLPVVMPENFVRPDQPSKCTWVKEKGEQPKNPHTKRQL